MSYHTVPPPSYPEFLNSPIPRKKTVRVLCPDCERVMVMWSPTVGGVLVCPYCNCRLVDEYTRPFPHR
jgi:ribosomal protein S27E